MPDAMASSAERDRSRSPPALRPPSSGPAGADLQAGSLPVARILGQRVIVDDVPSLLDPLKLPRRGARKDARSRLGDLHEEECFGTKMRVHIEPAWLLFTSEEALYLHSERRAIRLVLPVAEDHSSTAASDDEVANAFFRSCSLRDVPKTSNNEYTFRDAMPLTGTFDEKVGQCGQPPSSSVQTSRFTQDASTRFTRRTSLSFRRSRCSGATSSQELALRMSSTRSSSC
eukprot:TRINITY_DN38121_c0_g1_i2.p1 TRINITY_DN38121_c0_g1~~TRINITY_DN38121_c0_g1_i2.p1  ORF type:complete len:229 (+),score=46.40 TRINITY_DN38121_c0_g1_i2:120-806(+)